MRWSPPYDCGHDRHVAATAQRDIEQDTRPRPHTMTHLSLTLILHDRRPVNTRSRDPCLAHFRRPKRSVHRSDVAGVVVTRPQPQSWRVSVSGCAVKGRLLQLLLVSSRHSVRRGEHILGYEGSGYSLSPKTHMEYKDMEDSREICRQQVRCSAQRPNQHSPSSPSFFTYLRIMSQACDWIMELHNYCQKNRQVVAWSCTSSGPQNAMTWTAAVSSKSLYGTEIEPA
ncbi:hypothetical protein C8Q70DRAFT_457114 [Cubamyces menziesii]|nr:hypothetical protein C8Q70DRAFT_457114 [Cubamyces menziesii]